jgi:predicted nucleic acid-binding protein
LNVFVDTSVWSHALRRDSVTDPKALFLGKALAGDDMILTTGLVLQELLQGFRGPKQKERIIDYFSLLPMIVPDLDDHINAASLRNMCRRKGIQVGTIDALIATLCIRHDLHLLTTDEDFPHVVKHTSLSLVKV